MFYVFVLNLFILICSRLKYIHVPILILLYTFELLFPLHNA